MVNVLVKPIGPVCNLECDYCFYLKKQDLYPDQPNFTMDDQTLERFIKQYIEIQPGPIVNFAWQGGEPTLLGIDFFERVIELQKKYLPQGWQVENAIQTNGTLLDAQWCEFLKEHNFLVGISLDGAKEFHDKFRKDKGNKGTHHRVIAGLQLLQDYDVAYNVLCAVSEANVNSPLATYQFLVENGIKYIQFIPIIEQLGSGLVSERSITGVDYGRFLTTIFNHWIVNDIGEVSIQLFEQCFSIWSGYGSSLCILSETCGQALAIEHNGDLYACDHFVEPDYFLGNIFDQDLSVLAFTEQIGDFGQAKKTELPDKCRACPVLFVCNGGCPKNRVNGLNILCEGYQQFFGYIDPFIKSLTKLISIREPVPMIREQMQAIYQDVWNSGRNDLCPCKSGKKYKKCCW